MYLPAMELDIILITGYILETLHINRKSAYSKRP